MYLSIVTLTHVYPEDDGQKPHTLVLGVFSSSKEARERVTKLRQEYKEPGGDYTVKGDHFGGFEAHAPDETVVYCETHSQRVQVEISTT